MVITILMSTVLILFGYYHSHGCPVRNGVLAVAVVVLMCICDPALRGLSVSLYASAVLLIFVALQVLMPIAAGQPRRMIWQVGRVQFAMVVQ